MFKLTSRKLIGVFIAASVIAAAVGGPAFADQYSENSSPNVVITGGVGPRFDDVNGDGIFPTVNNFQPITLNGTPQLTAATIDPFTVVDDSGDEAGWNVTLTVPDMEDGGGADCGTLSTHTLDMAGLSMNPAVVAIATNDTSMTGVTPSGFTDFTAARKIVVATATNGMGSYTVSPQLLKLVVPATTAAGTFCSQATIAIASAP